MCRLALQLLGMLGNVLGMLCNVLGMPATSSADLDMLLQGPRSLTTPLASQFIRQQVGGFLFDVGLLGPCKSMLRSAEDIASMPRTLQSMPRTAEDGRGRCQACLGIAK